MTEKELLDEIISKYGEWFEMEGYASPHLMIRILSHMIVKERDINECLRKVIKLTPKCIDLTQSNYNNINS